MLVVGRGCTPFPPDISNFHIGMKLKRRFRPKKSSLFSGNRSGENFVSIHPSENSVSIHPPHSRICIRIYISISKKKIKSTTN